MPINRGSQDPRFELGSVQVAALASPSRGDAKDTIMYRVELPAGAGLPTHRHDHDEVFHLQSGRLVSILEGERHDVEAGDTVIIPAGVLHTAEATEDSRMLVAMPVGTLFVPEEGEARVPAWGQ